MSIPVPVPLSTRLAAIDTLRAVAVLWVIAGHALVTTVKLGGPIGQLSDPIHPVGLFFAVSGALVARSLIGLSSTHRIRALGVFIVRRWLRLALPHAGALLVYSLPVAVTLLAPIRWNIDAPSNPVELVALLGLFSAWFPFSATPTGDPAVAISTVVIGNWSISAEWFAAVIVIPYATLLLRRPRSMAVMATAIAVIFSLAGGNQQWVVVHAPSFVVGVWAARIAVENTAWRGDALLMLGGAVLAIAIGLLVPGASVVPGFELLWGPLVLFALRRSEGLPGRFGGALVWLGGRSYGAYLFHMLGLAAAYGLVAAHLTGLALWAVIFAAGVGAAIVGGALTARLLEAPAIAIGRTLARRLDPR